MTIGLADKIKELIEHAQDVLQDVVKQLGEAPQPPPVLNQCALAVGCPEACPIIAKSDHSHSPKP